MAFYFTESDEIYYVAVQYDRGWLFLIFWIAPVNVDFVFVFSYTVNYDVYCMLTNYTQQKGIGVGVNKGEGRGKAHIFR